MSLYDWSTAPEWAMFGAIDESGDGSWYECEPLKGYYAWWSGGGRLGIMGNKPDLEGVPWDQSREARPVTKTPDPVANPAHYTSGGIECIDAIRASMSREGFEDYAKGNVLKYLWRWRQKGGAEDLRKARVYLDWLIESAEANP